MKGKLNRRDGDYWLHNESGETIASSWGVYGKKLSGQNCDEIFGVVDVEKLAEEDSKLLPDSTQKMESLHHQIGFARGFNKALELNRDKQFTLDDIQEAHRLGWDSHKDWVEGKETNVLFLDWIKSKQPTEIEVEIKMEPCFYDDSLGGFSTSYTEDKPKEQPKLDSEGCLILKRFNIK